MTKRLAIVLAAGKGTRMESDLPKVLVEVHGRPLIDYVLDALQATDFSDVLVVVGYRSDDVRRALAGRDGVAFVEQAEQLGTGHAVMMCREHLEGYEGPVLIITGDSPLAQADSFRLLLERFQRERPACVMGTLHKDDPSGLGRIVREKSGDFAAIIEEKDATGEQRRITEVNMSTYVFDCRDLLDALDRVTSDNRQNEYYITDCPGILKAFGKTVLALPVLKPCEALSVNTIEDLDIVAAEMKRMGY